MNDEKRPVICPYCKAIMKSEVRPSRRFGGGVFTAAFVCPGCYARAPLAWSTHKENAEGQAWCNALRIGLGKYSNRVLTLDEVLIIAIDDYNTEQETVMYLEDRESYEGYAIVTDMEADSNSNILLEFSGIGGGVKPNEKDYGSLWRCWLRKPTKEEREAVAWLPEKKEEESQ